MPFFFLEPVSGNEQSHHWRASTLAPVGVWVRAADETEAREQVTQATIIATRHVPGQEMAMAPWMDQGLVTCARDDKHVPPPGVVLTAHGQTLTVKDD